MFRKSYKSLYEKLSKEYNDITMDLNMTNKDMCKKLENIRSKINRSICEVDNDCNSLLKNINMSIWLNCAPNNFEECISCTGDKTCVICLEEDEDVRTMCSKCKNMFHNSCISKWIDEKEGNKCPACRGEGTKGFGRKRSKSRKSKKRRSRKNKKRSRKRSKKRNNSKQKM